MKPGDKIYRVFRLEETGKWYYCIYEYVRAVVTTGLGCGWIEVAPILTFYNASYKSHSTIPIKHFHKDIIDEWVRSWDYITSDEYLALAVYKEKTKDEN